MTELSQNCTVKPPFCVAFKLGVGGFGMTTDFRDAQSVNLALPAFLVECCFLILSLDSFSFLLLYLVSTNHDVPSRGVTYRFWTRSRCSLLVSPGMASLPISKSSLYNL